MVGCDPERFWGITPRLYAIEIEVAIEREKRRAEAIITGGWVGGAVSRSEKLLPLSDFIGGAQAQPSGGRDLNMYLGELECRLPKITMAEWQRRASSRAKGAV